MSFADESSGSTAEHSSNHEDLSLNNNKIDQVTKHHSDDDDDPSLVLKSNNNRSEPTSYDMQTKHAEINKW